MRYLFCLLLACSFPLMGSEAPVCTAVAPFATFSIRHVRGEPKLTLNEHAKVWRTAAAQPMSKDCSREIDYTELKSEIRSFWTDKYLYFLFRCPYQVLNLFLPPDNSGPRRGLWDRDVVEMFLGYDWQNIRHYREFEIAPTGDWIDLAIDLDHKNYDHNWRSGWQTMARIDKANKVWYAAARIPLSAITPEAVKPGTRWRMNLYRIDGLGADPQRHFMCWQPTCVQNRDPNHVPEHFGTLIFEK
ncbi:MAG TPA: carbohydrate-binding family 9-like protein [Bryobacteraceae bacterium]|nr:carbohydrate-binding family 9-like protein [Bryobacteraceae bacterium]